MIFLENWFEPFDYWLFNMVEHTGISGGYYYFWLGIIYCGDLAVLRRRNRHFWSMYPVLDAGFTSECARPKDGDGCLCDYRRSRRARIFLPLHGARRLYG